MAELYGDQGPNKKAKVSKTLSSRRVCLHRRLLGLLKWGIRLSWRIRYLGYDNQEQLQRLRIRVPRTIYVNVVGLNAERNARKLVGCRSKRISSWPTMHEAFEVNFSEARYHAGKLWPTSSQTLMRCIREGAVACVASSAVTKVADRARPYWRA